MSNPLLYNVSTPSIIKEGKKYPVIYAMHGMGSNEKDIMSLLTELKEDFIIIGIRGGLIRNSGFAYFTIKSFGNPDIDSFDEAVANLEDFITNIKNEYPIDTSKQFLIGFSQGSILSMTLALKLGNKIKGIVALSGYIPKHVINTYSVKPVNEASIFIAHGNFDQVFPINIGNDNYEFFKNKTNSLEFKQYPIGHEVSLEEKNDFISWFKLNK